MTPRHAGTPIRHTSMKTFKNRKQSAQVGLRKAAHGFTLIELLVGMVMSLLTIVAIYQVLAVWDASRRTVTSGSGAQISGSIGSFEIERSLQVAGMGFGNVLKDTIGCTVQARNSNFSPTDYSFTFVPIEIVNGASGAPDIVRVLSGDSAYANSVQKLYGSTATTKQLQGNTGFNAGDLIIVAGSNTPRDCALFEVTGNSSTSNTIDHVTTPYTPFYTTTVATPLMNPPPGGATFNAGGEAYNLGPGAQRVEWRVNGSTATAVLTRSNTLRDTTTFEVAEGIVNLQAQYGIDGLGTGVFNGRIEASEWSDTLPATSEWHRVLAVRVALLARSSQYEKDTVVTPLPSTWSGGTFTMVNLDGSTAATTGVNDWRHYRFRVYESVVTLRNMLWGAAI
jgi:type IV pilus assembly protein PilW